MIRKYMILFFCSMGLLFAVDAKIEIVKKGKVLPKILVSVATDTQNSTLSNNVKKTVTKDLLVSGHFELEKNEMSTAFESNPDMIRLRNSGVDLYLNLAIEQSQFSGFLLKIKLYDINSGLLVINRALSTSQTDRFPFVAHRTAIMVNKHLNAPSIDWMDKFVVFSVYKSSKQADIVIADYTLAFQKKIIRGGLNIFPKWANKEQDSFYYTTYVNGTPQLKKFGLYNRTNELIGTSEGMIACSDVSDDGSKILVTASPEGQPDIYLFDIKKKIKQKLTKYKGIDVGAHFVENDTKIVFVSDRLKHPNIFSKKINGRGVERLVYHGRNNSSATTHENLVVYTSREGNNEFSSKAFNLYLISTQSDFIKRLTSNGRNQFPKFSQDGESILFIKDYKGKSSLGIIRLNYDKSFLFPLNSGKLQSIDW